MLDTKTKSSFDSEDVLEVVRQCLSFLQPHMNDNAEISS